MCEMYLEIAKFDVAPILIRYRVTEISVLEESFHNNCH